MQHAATAVGVRNGSFAQEKLLLLLILLFLALSVFVWVQVP